MNSVKIPTALAHSVSSLRQRLELLDETSNTTVRYFGTSIPTKPR